MTLQSILVVAAAWLIVAILLLPLVGNRLREEKQETFNDLSQILTWIWPITVLAILIAMTIAGMHIISMMIVYGSRAWYLSVKDFAPINWPAKIWQSCVTTFLVLLVILPHRRED